MTDLRLDALTMPTAPLGPDNPLPPLFGSGNRDYQVDMTGALGAIREGSEYGRVASIAPYLMQDDYGRERTLAEHPVAVLENSLLTATFLLNQGGRLWSLVHRPSGRELLFRNSVLQPANLSLRNAWFAGGVEWNVGTIGHTPGTYSPIHAARVMHSDGTPGLRMWEFDRIRRTVHQIDVHLPEDSAALFVHVRIRNPHAHDVPTYWWSNIAVAQSEGTRVVSCADRAWTYAYGDRLDTTPIVDAERDASYPGRALDAADYFFDTEEHPTPWVAALDERGTGLVQVSSSRLRGRKLFLWGEGTGGKRWQEWLCGPGQSYLEIQAGLARTQFEHVRLPAGGEISWVEAYGRLDVDPERAHGDWDDARTACEEAVAELVSPGDLEAELAIGDHLARHPITAPLHAGSGWGALERTVLGALATDTLNGEAAPFRHTTLTGQQQDWIDLLRTGRFPHNDPSAFPRSFEVGPLWEHVLAPAAAVEGAWVERALLGNALAAREDLDGARDAWLESVAARPNALALRNLGALSHHRGDLGQARSWYEQALKLAPQHLALVAEALRHLAAHEPEWALGVIDRAGEGIRSNPRVRLLEAVAATATLDLERAGAILEGDLEVADLREGELSLVDAWWDYCTARRAVGQGIPVSAELRAEVQRTVPVPARLDFRMSRDLEIVEGGVVAP